MHGSPRPVPAFPAPVLAAPGTRPLTRALSTGLNGSPRPAPGPRACPSRYKAINARPEYLALLKQVVHARFHVNELGIVTGPKESCMPGTVDTSSVLYKEFVETNVGAGATGPW